LNPHQQLSLSSGVSPEQVESTDHPLHRPARGSQGRRERLDANATALDLDLDLEDAERAHHRASMYDPKNPLFLSNRAEVLMKLADHQQPKDMFLEVRLHYRLLAQQLLRQACSETKHQNIKYAYLRNGHYLLSRGDLREAEHYYGKALHHDASFVVAARNLASVYSIIGDYDKAIKVCDDALGLLGQNGGHLYTSKVMHGWIHNSRGWAYLLKARQRRFDLKRAFTDPHAQQAEFQTVWKDRECESWLKAAEVELQEAIKVLKHFNHHFVPAFNLYLTYVEEEFLGVFSASDYPTVLELTKDLMEHNESPMAEIYSSILHSINGF
jgi:tetratricopeptide (TPR) repeat protein